MPSFAENLIRGMQAGQQHRQQKQAEANAAEDRAIEKMLLQHKLRQLKIDEKLAARGLAKQNFDLMEGRPSSEFPVSGAGAVGAAPSGLPGGVPIPLLDRSPKPMTIPGVSELGVGDVAMTPHTLEEMLLAQRRAELSKPVKLGAGENLTIPLTGQTVASGPPKPRTFQQKEVSVKGKPTVVNFDPASGQSFLQGSDTPIPADQIGVYERPPDPALQQIRAATLANLQRGQATMTPAQFSMASRLADDYTQASKDYLTRLQAAQSIEAAAKDPSAAGDLALIFSYMRMLDPGSTVREGEFANAQNAAGVPDKIRNIWNRAVSGERLNPTQRADFLRQSQSQFGQAQTRQRGLLRVYEARARSAGLDPSFVIIDYDKEFGITPPTGGGGQAQIPGYVVRKKGGD